MAKRTPRNFLGTEVVTKSLQQLLPEFLREISSFSANHSNAIFQEWFLLLGETMGSFTEPVAFIDGVLKVKIKSSSLYSLLVQHEKKRLLSELQLKFPIRDILFKIG